MKKTFQTCPGFIMNKYGILSIFVSRFTCSCIIQIHFGSFNVESRLSKWTKSLLIYDVLQPQLLSPQQSSDISNTREVIFSLEQRKVSHFAHFKSIRGQLFSICPSLASCLQPNQQTRMSLNKCNKLKCDKKYTE